MAAEPQRPPAKSGEKKPEEEEVSALEDLMREHGVLGRILLVYEELLSRLRAGAPPVAEPLRQAAALVQRFVEEYHEKLEEDFLFPQFEKRGVLVPLVRVLRVQHAAGRVLTARILHDITADRLADPAGRAQVAADCRAFVRMYRPHKAREDTVLFPAAHKVFTAKSLDELGDRFEEQEDRRFGEGGFEKIVAQVAALEQSLGIYELEKFTTR
jgi:hemerythrin-like domain-containing protein